MLESVQTVVIHFSDAENVDRYVHSNDVPFPMLSDPDRATYRRYGLTRAPLWRVYGWRAARRYYEIYREKGLGHMRRATEDTRQLGGDFVIDPDGRLAYARWSTGPADRPPAAELTAHLRRKGH